MYVVFEVKSWDKICCNFFDVNSMHFSPEIINHKQIKL